jgi:OmpA-OmpF porin, OOP family
MSYQPNKWAIGLVPLAILWALGTVAGLDEASKTLSGNIKGAIGDDVDGAEVDVSGRDIALRGEAFTHASQKNAVDTALSVPGVRSVDSRGLGVVSAVAPYSWWMVRNGGRVTLSGSSPNAKAKAAMAADAKGLGLADVLDRTTYGRGDSEALPAAAAFAAQVLANFSRGAATYTDGSLDVSGVAADAAGYEKALALLKAPPAGVKLAAAEVTPPVASPYVFSAAHAGDKLTLSGGAASAEAGAALAKLAGQLFPGVKIENKLAVKSGAPGAADKADNWALTALAKLKSGKADVRDTGIALTGDASGPGDIEDVAAFADKAPAGFSVAADKLKPA